MHFKRIVPTAYAYDFTDIQRFTYFNMQDVTSKERGP